MANLEVEVKIISKETIKPSSPTPLHLKTFNLSFFDQFQPTNVATSLLAFYPQLLDHDHDHDQDQDQDQDRRLRDLKSSFSETLTRFYPLAGRIIENEPFIDCSDDGAQFIEAKVSCRLSDILKHPDPTLLRKLYALNTVSLQDSHILLVQTNLFDCGGIAISVSISHKIAGASTLTLFVKGWAAQARGVGHMVVPDMTSIASRFPVIDDPISSWSDSTSSCKTRRYVFDSRSINTLRARAMSESVQRPSRVEVVTGHIWLRVTKLNLSRTKPCSYILVQPMDLRKRIDPPLSDNSFGNLVGHYSPLAQESDENVTKLEDVVVELRRGLQTAIQNFSKKNAGPETFLGKSDKKIQAPITKFVLITSWCKFMFYENLEFGWGKPVWVSSDDFGMKNVVKLMDSKCGDGVEAWLTLDEDIMDLLETDQEFLEFAALNPSVDFD